MFVLALAIVILTKLRATGTFLARTPLNMFFIQDSHALHSYCGWVVFVDGTLHSVAHILRWINQGNVGLLFSHRSGLSGLVAFVAVWLIVLPMVLFKNRVKFEIRKVSHYMFLVMTFALCFHSPPSAVPNGGFAAYIFSILLVWYMLDAFYCTFFMTELIDTTFFHTLSSGVQMTMKVSKRFQSWGEHGGYCYVCFPWVDRWQWHAFSLYENPDKPEERQIFVATLGDWTTRVHELLQRDSVRPAWIQGPFKSPWSNAIHFDNQILVATGIGITPALSVICAHKDSRRINLIWVVRDASMLQFFLEKAYLDHRGWNLIFYTGKEPLVSSVIRELTCTNVCVIEERPKLEHVLPNIIYGIESGEGLPERYILDQKATALNYLSERLDELDQQEGLTTPDKISELSRVAQEHGYIFQDLFAALIRTQNSGNDAGPEKDPLLNNAVPFLQDEMFLATIRKSLVTRLSLSSRDSMEARRSNKSVDQARRGSFRFRQDASVLRQHWDTIIDDIGLDFEPWKENEESTKYVKKLDEHIRKTWGILFCGGQGPLHRSVLKVAKNLSVDVHTESFQW